MAKNLSEFETEADPHSFGETTDYNGETWHIYLYQPNMVATTKNMITFFIPDEDINTADLLQYKEQTQTQLLIAVDTYGRYSGMEDIADAVIDCWYGEASEVMLGIANTVREDGFVGSDEIDLKNFLTGQTNPIKFTQIRASGNDCWDVAIAKVVFEIQDNNARGVLLSIATHPNFDLEYYSKLIEAIKKNTIVDNANIWVTVVFEYDDYWAGEENGCDIKLFLSYSAKDYGYIPPAKATWKVMNEEVRNE